MENKFLNWMLVSTMGLQVLVDSVKQYKEHWLVKACVATYPLCYLNLISAHQNLLIISWVMKKLWADFDDIFRITLQGYKQQLIWFLGCSGSPCWLSKSLIRAILSNEVPYLAWWPVFLMTGQSLEQVNLTWGLWEWNHGPKQFIHKQSLEKEYTYTI